MHLENATFLLTGGTAGIGRTLTLDLLARGANVVICGRDAERLEALGAEYPELTTVRCDVRDDASVAALCGKTLETVGPPDYLINNAAIFRRFELRDTSVPLERWTEEIEINLLGALRVTHALLPHMIDRGRGTVVNVTSPSAYIPLANAPIYSASKAALQSFTVSLRHKLRGSGVSAIELNPPAVDTQMNSGNPDVEDLKLWSTKDFSEYVLKRLHPNSGDILVGDAKLVSRMRRLAPGFVFRKMNPPGPVDR